jgi:hypothetical protein
MEIMNSQQANTIGEYENEIRRRGGNRKLDWNESNASESRGVLFAEVDGVTLMVYPDGLINIPARCSWSFDKYTHVTAAACAKVLWARQKKRDDNNPEAAKKRAGGHLGPLVGPDLKCRVDDCPCQKELPQMRQRRSLGSRNAKQDLRKEKYRGFSGCH